MEKITLPIKEEKEDNINPLNPDFGWLLKMLAITIPIFIISYLFFYIFSYFIIGGISLEKEKELFSKLLITENNYQIFNVNKILSNKISNLENVDIYLEDSLEINAYAFLGGNIVLTTGLLENIDYEEELIFIIGHEIEHIKNRDVLQSLLTDIPFYLTLQFIGFDFSNQIFDITKKYTSKQTELKADDGGIQLINKMNLNLNCSLNFFEKENNIFESYLQLISTHPTNIKRIKNIKEQNLNKDKECSEFIYDSL